MIVQKGLPALRRGPAPLDHIFGDGGLGGIYPELPEFAVKARRTPECTGEAHLPNEIAQFSVDFRPPTAGPRFPAPERPKPHAMPAHDTKNVRAKAITPGEEDTIGFAKSGAGF